VSEIDLTVVRICEERCPTCIFGPRSPIVPARRDEYERKWRELDRFQNCHYGTHVGDSALVCRGFADWCDAVRWWPTILQLGARLDRIRYVPVPEIEP
jgi:hypothetical protein